MLKQGQVVSSKRAFGQRLLLQQLPNEAKLTGEETMQFAAFRRREKIHLLAAGVATFISGDNLYSFRSLVQHSEVLFPSYVDFVYLAVYPLLVAGLALLVHRRTGAREDIPLDAALARFTA